MNHLKKIAEKLPEYGLDAMLITSESGEVYSVGFHGEGVVLVTKEKCWYATDSRYIEAAGAIEGVELLQLSAAKSYRQMVAELVS